MSDTPYMHNPLSNSEIYQDARTGHINTVTHAPGGGHLHTAYDPYGDIYHTDYTFSTGVKLDVNPSVSPSFGGFLGGQGQ